MSPSDNEKKNEWETHGRISNAITIAMLVAGYVYWYILNYRKFGIDDLQFPLLDTLVNMAFVWVCMFAVVSLPLIILLIIYGQIAKSPKGDAKRKQLWIMYYIPIVGIISYHISIWLAFLR